MKRVKIKLEGKKIKKVRMKSPRKSGIMTDKVEDIVGGLEKRLEWVEKVRKGELGPKPPLKKEGRATVMKDGKEIVITVDKV